MEWFLKLILQMYAAHRKTMDHPPLAPQYAQLAEMLTNIHAWANVSAKEDEASFGMLFTLIFILEKRFQLARTKKEIIDEEKFKKIVMTAHILAWKNSEELLIHLKNFLQSNSSPETYELGHYNKRQLYNMEQELLTAINYRLMPDNPRQITAIIKKYCNNDDIKLILSSLNKSSNKHTLDYAILLFLANNPTLDDLLQYINEMPTIPALIQFATLLLPYYNDHPFTAEIARVIEAVRERAITIAKATSYMEKTDIPHYLAELVELLAFNAKAYPPSTTVMAVIESAQQRTISLAYKNPLQAKAHQDDHLRILSVASPITADKKLVAEFRGIVKIQTEYTPDWHLHFIYNWLHGFTILYPFGYSCQKKYTGLTIFEAIELINFCIDKDFTIKSRIAFFVAEYLKVTCQKNKYISADFFIAFYLSLIFNEQTKEVGRALKSTYLLKFRRILPLYLMGKDTKLLCEDTVFKKFLSENSSIPQGSNNDLDLFLTTELDEASFLQLCGSMMSHKERLDNPALKMITGRLKKFTDINLILSVLYCAKSPEQLQQLKAALKTREFSFLKEKNSPSGTLFKDESAWSKIEFVINIMQKYFEVGKQACELAAQRRVD